LFGFSRLPGFIEAGSRQWKKWPVGRIPSAPPNFPDKGKFGGCRGERNGPTRAVARSGATSLMSVPARENFRPHCGQGCRGERNGPTRAVARSGATSLMSVPTKENCVCLDAMSGRRHLSA
jgi:hypothetical protein